MRTPLAQRKGLTFSMMCAYIMQKYNVLKRIRFFFFKGPDKARKVDRNDGVFFYLIRAVARRRARRPENTEKGRLPRGTRNRIGTCSG